MNYSEFRSLVNTMRCAQREYFRTRSSTALEDSKRAEKAVDKALAEYDSGQRKMFDDEATTRWSGG